MDKLVSVIIPCFNAEVWLKEAIDSALNQSYSAVEIIVIDDGSTDASLEVIKSYGSRLIWESGSNRGGNYARNRGFKLSRGDFIQFLDADDYLLYEKIARQVDFLRETDVDVVYGDWRHQYHLPDGSSYLEDIRVSGTQSDVLESLLADWWVSPASLLVCRKAVIRSGGWNEGLKAGQDRDFFISLVMSGAKVAYQPGCHSIYRRYGDTTVSTSSKEKYLDSHFSIIQNAEGQLSRLGKLSKKYRCALAQSYFKLARGYLDTDYTRYSELLDKALTLCPTFKPEGEHRTVIYNLAQNVLGFRNTEKGVAWVKANMAKLKM